MNQKFLVLKATEEDGGKVAYSYIDTLICEKNEARQCAADLVADIGDGTFYVMPLGDKITATTRRVIEGVKATRPRTEAKDAKPAKKKLGRGLPKDKPAE